jgi:integrase
MPKGRPALEPGHHGGITVQSVGPSRYKARAYYRATNGQRYTMSRFGQTKAAARRALEAALVEWQRAGGQPPLPNTRVAEAAVEWLARLERRDVAVGTRQLYAGNVVRYVLPYLGELRLSEATPRAVNLALTIVADRHGPAAAKSTRAVLNGIFGDAVRDGTLLINPVREARVTQPRRSQPRALTRDEAADLVDKLRADDDAVHLDLPDLADFMLGTGCRIGEALAVRESAIDLDERTVTIHATVTRVTGVGLVLQEHTKSLAGNRLLPLPQFVCDLITRREGEVRFEAPEAVVFPSPFGPRLRDPSNTTKAFRVALNRYGYDWVTSHTFRKTAITWLRQAQLDDELIASFGGHSDLMTSINVYTGRNKVVDRRAAEVLDR